jgi:hypothetical protein
MNRQFSEEIQMSNNYLKKCSTSLITKESTLRFHLTPVRLVVIKEKKQENAGEKNPHTLLVGMQTSATSMDISMEIPKKLKTDLPYDPAIPLMGIYLKECKSIYKRDSYITHIYCSFLHNIQTVETAEIPNNR